MPRTPGFLRRKLPSGASASSSRRSDLLEDEKKKLFLPDKPKEQHPPTSLNDSLEVDNAPPEFADHQHVESEAMNKIWSQFKIKDTLELGEDFYSLAFYGFYLEDDEEDLTISRNIEKVKRKIFGSEQGLRRSKSLSKRTSMVNDEISESEDEFGGGRMDLNASFTTETKKEFLLKMKKKWREGRNLKNFYKIELIFGFQITLQVSLLYAIVLAPVFSGTDAQTETDFPFAIFVIKYICSIILHMTM